MSRNRTEKIIKMYRYRLRCSSIDCYPKFSKEVVLLEINEKKRFLIVPQCQIYLVINFYDKKFFLYFNLTNPVFCSTDPHLSPKSFNSNSLTCFFDKYSEDATVILAAATDFTYGIEVKGNKNSSPAA